MKHTPGPWKITDIPDEHDADAYFNVESDEWIVARVWADVPPLALSSEANANLIAASPALLAFVEDQKKSTNCICKLKAIVKGTHLESDLECTHCRADKLIRQAKGE